MALGPASWSWIACLRIRTLAFGWIGAVLLSFIWILGAERQAWHEQSPSSSPPGRLTTSHPAFVRTALSHISLGLLGLAGLGLARRMRVVRVARYRDVIRQLRASEARYRLLVETSPAAVVVVDASGEVIEANESALRLHAVADPGALLRQPVLRFVAPEDRQIFREHLQPVLTRQRVANVELHLLRQNGGRFLAEIKAAQMSSRLHGPRVIAVIRDMSEERAMVEALRSSEQRYRRISELTSDLMSSFTVDSSGRLVPEWTAGASERITGYAVDELNERGGLFSIMDPSFLARAQRNFSGVLAGQAYSDEFRITTKSGQSRWLHGFGLAEKDPLSGRVVRLYHAVQDITARKSTEQELSAKTAQLEAVLQHSPSGIVVLDRSGNVVLWNLGAERILGWSASEVLGKEPPGLTDDQRRLLRERYDREPRPLAGGYHHFTRKDGVPIEVLITTSLFPDASGATAGIIGVFEDATDSKRNAEFAAARLRLGDFAQSHSLGEILRAAADEAVRLTGSEIGFVCLEDDKDHGLDMQVWTTAGGTAVESGEPVTGDSALHLGMRAECVRRCGPVIHNNIALSSGRSEPNSKPRGLAVPVLREGQVAAVMGVTGRAADYTDKDVEVLSTLAGLAWDIVVRKKAEDELRLSEERLRAIFDSVPDPVYLKDAERRYTRVNTAFEKYFCTSARAVIGKTREEVFGTQNSAEMLALEQQALAGIPVRKEVQLIFSGEERAVEFVEIPLFDRANRTVGICATARDITERKRTETALRRAHSRAQRLLEVAGVMIVALSPDGTIALMNRKGCEILGCEQEDVLGTNWLQSFVRESDRPWVDKLLKRLLRGEMPETGEFELSVRTRSGAERRIAWNSTLVREPDGTILGIISSGEDVTIRKQAEETLRHAEARQRLAMEAATMGWWDWEATTRTMTYGGIYEAILGLPASALGSLPENLFLRIHPDDRTRLKRLFVSLVRGRDVFEAEYRIVRLDGSVSWAHSRGQAYRDHTGAILRVVGVIQNIDDRKQAEAKLLRSQEALVESETRLRQTLTSAYLGTWDLDLSTNRLVTGGTHEELFGFEAGSGTDVHEVYSRVHPEDQPLLEKTIAFSRRTRAPFSVEFRTLVPGREVRWLRTQGQIVSPPGEPASRILGVVWDVTQRRKVEEDLRRSRERLQALFDHSPIAIWEDDFSAVKKHLDHLQRAHPGNLAEVLAARPQEVRRCARLIRVVDANQTSVRIMGADSKADFTGNLLDYLAPETLEPMALMLAALAEGRTRVEFEAPVRNVRQEQRIFAITATVIPGCEHTLEKVLVCFLDVTERKRAELALRNSLLEKEAMLKEIHHRVKNNLQLVSSLMRLRGNQLQNPEGRAALDDTQARIRSMALLHEALYRSDNLASINLQEYIIRLTSQILRATPGSDRIHLSTDVEPLPVSLDTAIPCGLIINELIVNCLKHAFPPGREGKVRLRFEKLDATHVQLTVSDDGVGLPAGLDLLRSESLGLQLVGDLVRQLGGSCKLDGPPGATFTIVFPLSPSLTPRADI